MPNSGRTSPVPADEAAVIDIPDLEEVDAIPEDTATHRQPHPMSLQSPTAMEFPLHMIQFFGRSSTHSATVPLPFGEPELLLRC